VVEILAAAQPSSWLPILPRGLGEPGLPLSPTERHFIRATKPYCLRAKDDTWTVGIKLLAAFTAGALAISLGRAIGEIKDGQSLRPTPFAERFRPPALSRQFFAANACSRGRRRSNNPQTKGQLKKGMRELPEMVVV